MSVIPGKFQDGKAIGTVDADIGEVVELRLRVIEQPKNWVILSNVSINYTYYFISTISGKLS